MILNKPHLCSVLEIWAPKYNTASGDWEVWVSRSKVAHSTPVIIIKFTKARHLQGQRFCVRRQDVERSDIGSNGRIPVYKVPFGKLEGYDTPADVLNTIEELGW